MSVVVVLMILAFIIFTSPYIAGLIKLPVSATEILLGIFFGSLGLLEPNEAFATIANVGFCYLMFLAGVKVNLKFLITTDIKILKSTMLYMGLLYIFSTLGILILGLDKLYIIVVPIMSVGILSTFYKEYGENHAWLNTAMLVGVIGEVISIALLTILTAFSKYGFDIKLVINLGALAGFLLITTLVFRWIDVLFWWFPWLKKALMPQFDKNEKDIRLSIALLCFVIAITIILDIKIIIGAFIAGTFIPTFFEHKKDLPAKLESFGYGFLVPIFFVYIGSTVDTSAFSVKIAKNIALLTLAMVSLRIVSGVAFSKIFSKKEIVLFGSSLSIPLTLLIATATTARETGNLNDELYYTLVLGSVFQAIVCTTFIKVVYNFKKSKI